MARNSRHKSHLILVEAIAQGQSVAQASRMAGVSARTSFRRLADPNFQLAVADCRAAMFAQATGMLAAATTKAAGTLETLLDDESSSIRLSAAKAILESGQRLQEALNVNQRLFDLEACISGGTKVGMNGAGWPAHVRTTQRELSGIVGHPIAASIELMSARATAMTEALQLLNGLGIDPLKIIDARTPSVFHDSIGIGSVDDDDAAIY